MPRELDARHTHQGCYSSWLTKVKGDAAKAKWIQSSGRRYFTIDFETQIVYYAHGETDKRISLPILFRDILCASMISSPPRSPGHGENHSGQVLRRSHSGSWLGRQSAGGCPFVFQTRDRRIRLTADSEANAFSWVEMLNAAHAIGQGDGPSATGHQAGAGDIIIGRAVTSPVANGRETRLSETVEAPLGTPPAALRSATSSPTELGSITTSASTMEGSEFTEASSFTESSPRQSAEALSPKSPSLSAALSPPVIEPAAKQVETTLALKPRANWQTAAEAAKAGLSSSRRLCLADFGFDGEGSGEEGVCVRDSSPDSVTISPRPRAGPPVVALVGGTGCLTDREQFRCEVRSPSDEVCFCDSEDDGSDCEAVCEVRDRRIELDLELAKAQQRRLRPARRESSPPRKHKDRQSHIDGGERHVALIAPAVVSKTEFVEPAERDEARIAADLRLLRNPGGASSIAMAPAPLRKRAQADSDEFVDQDKARRKAERKAAKQAAKQLIPVEPTRADRHVADTVAVARDAWAEGPGGTLTSVF